MGITQREPIIGRAVLLAHLNAILGEAAAGRGGAAVLYGEAGIGKTRILEEISGMAEHHGFLVAWGHCTELEGVPPYWPWRQLLDALGMPAPTEPRSRGAMLSSVVDRVDEVTRTQPLLVCLEDVHWADADTRWLLEGLTDATAGRSVAVLCSWRTTEGPDEMTDLPPRMARVPVHGLGTSEAVELARRLGALLGRPPDGRVAADEIGADVISRAAVQSGGNPFFVRELVHMALTGAPGAERVPRGVRDVLTRRLARLASGTVEVMTAAAVLSSEAAIDVLAEALGQPEGVVMDCLDDAVGAGLVETLDRGRPVEFVHAVVREVLLDQAGAVGRSALHERAALALEQRRPAAHEALAWHWAQVPGPAAAEHTVRHARAGREAARAAHALEQAVAFAELVTTRGGDLEDLLALGDARARAGDLQCARSDLLRAAAAARAAGRADLQARSALGLAAGEGGFEVSLNDVTQVELLEEAARRLPPGGLRARVRARLAVATSVSAPLGDRVALARDAVTEAEDASDAEALLHALAAYADMVAGPRHVAERRAVAERMLRLAGDLGDPDGELLARRFRLVALLEEGDFASADLEIAAFDRLARRTRQPGHLWYPPLWRGMRGLLAGREADAEAYADEVEGIGRQAQSSNAYILATTLRFAARWGRPDGLAELLPALEEYGADVPPDYPPLLVTAASVWASIGDKDRAMRSYRPLAEQSFASIPEDAEFLSCLLGCTEAAVLLGDRVGAEALHALLTPHASRWIVDGIGAACWGVGAEWLARLEDLLGRRVDADRHRGEAAQAYQAAGAVGPLRRLTGAGAQPAGRHGELRHGAGGWVVTWAGEQTVLPDLKGMHDLATLVVRPGTPVPALTLLAGAAGVAIVPAGGSDEILDEQARSAYRDRLRALEDEIADATARGDLGRAEHHRDERDFLVRELSAALGLGGRPRRLGDESDRARKAVTMRLREVIMRLDGPMPALARHLRAAMRTGRECCYDPEEPVSWWVGSLPRPGDRWTG